MVRLDPELQLLLAKKDYFEAHPAEKAAWLQTDEAIKVLNISFQYKEPLDQLSIPGLVFTRGMKNVAYATVSLDQLQQLANHPVVISIERLRRKNPHLDTSVAEINARENVWNRSGDNFTGFSGEGVVIGIIDTGIHYKHKSFQHTNGKTRILSIWDQTLKPDPSIPAEKFPANFNDPTLGGDVDFGYGVVYNSDQINAGIRHKDMDSHGTHVAAIAAGNGLQSGNCGLSYNYIGVAPKADIIAVRLLGLTDGDDFSTLPPATKSVMTDAIKYIIHEAKKIPKPVVINLSLGSFTSSMDGSSSECIEMDEILAQNPKGVALVFSAGNDGASKWHARAEVSGVGELTLPFKVQEKDKEERMIMILYTGSNLSIQLTTALGGPDGLIPWISPTDPFVDNPKPLANGPGGEVNIKHDVSGTTSRISIKIKPAEKKTNLAGKWKIELKTINAVNTAIDAYIFTGGNNDPIVPKFLDKVSVQATLDTECTAKNVICVGSYRDSTGKLAASSARGKTMDGRIKPDLAAPGVGILSAASADAAAKDGGQFDGCCCDCCYDFYTTKGGTSMAAPHVSGVVALMMQQNKDLGYIAIRDKLIASARKFSDPQPVDDEMGWGGGKLDAKQAVTTTGGGGGGGGGGGDHFKQPVRGEMERLQEQFLGTYRGKRLNGLLRTFFMEIRVLINSNKKIATVWHRNKGPLWISAAFRAASRPSDPLPHLLEEKTLKECALHMAAILKKYCSPLLAHHLSECEQDLLLLHEGMNLYEFVGALQPAVVDSREHAGATTVSKQKMR